MKPRFYLSILFFLFCLAPLSVEAVSLKASYPRLANYYLRWELSTEEARQLANWDLLVLDMEVQENSPDSLRLIRELNPDVIILAYLTSQEIIDDVNLAAGNTGATLRRNLRSQISDAWWLKDPTGNRISNWPGTYMLNVSDGAGTDASGDKFNEFLPEFVYQNIYKSGYFDGVFYDNTWGDVTWINGANLDLDRDGRKDEVNKADLAWSTGFKKMLSESRRLFGNNFIIVGNGRVFQGYQDLLNGMMLESFPAPWENGGNWSGSMTTYLNLLGTNRYPQTSIINSSSSKQTDFKDFRFGLTSTLLGDGFYSFDYGPTNHTQTWWYDEYGVNLGPVRSPAYNLLSPKSPTIMQPGLWRRDFKFGSVIVNSSIKEQSYTFFQENFEKIKGTQDAKFNNGEKINFVKLPSNDGIVLLKQADEIYNTPFVNGYFYRVFNSKGVQLRNGFFSFSNAFPASASVIITDGSNSEEEDISLIADKGTIKLNKNGQQLALFYPYDKLFNKHLNISTDINNGFINTVAIGPGAGGGPQVRIFTATGRLLGSFFAYDKNLRGGVSVALGDCDGDGQLEVVTGPGKGSEPLVKVFDTSGNLKNSFLAYDKKFVGGIEVSLGDVNNDGSLEILTVPGPGGGPQVRIFTSQGKVLGQFFAYDQSYRAGLKISLGDLDKDGQTEILVGAKNFY